MSQKPTLTEAIATMVANPLVNAASVVVGGDRKEEAHEFYAKYFLPQIPLDTAMLPVPRTIGQGKLVEESATYLSRKELKTPRSWRVP